MLHIRNQLRAKYSGSWVRDHFGTCYHVVVEPAWQRCRLGQRYSQSTSRSASRESFSRHESTLTDRGRDATQWKANGAWNCLAALEVIYNRGLPNPESPLNESSINISQPSENPSKGLILVYRVETSVFRHRDVSFSTVHLARYALALNALCMDSRQFHGHDLIGTLQHHEPPTDYEFALTTLAACSAQAHVRKRQIRRLMDIASAVQYHNIGKHVKHKNLL